MTHRHSPPPGLQLEQLEDRLTPAGSEVPAGEFNWMQYSSTGELGQLVWNGGTLVYHSRIQSGCGDVAVPGTGGFAAGQQKVGPFAPWTSQWADNLVASPNNTIPLIFTGTDSNLG